MIRSRPFLAAMHRLAFVATLLMVCAPLVSRWLQAAPPDPQALCTTEGLRVAALASPAMDGAHAGHAMATTAGEAHGGGHAPDDGSGHAEHGFACDYCVLAARLLPWLAVALLVLPLLRAMAPGLRFAAIAPASTYWPAAVPRGPPLHA